MKNQYIKIKASASNGNLINGHTVTFLDYDGRFIKAVMVPNGGSVSLSEFPSNPPGDEHRIFSRWIGVYENVTRDEIVGACYWMNADLNSYLFITLNTITTLTISLRITVGTGYVLGINWGDGASESTTGTGLQTLTHTYATYGEYKIAISGMSGSYTNYLGGGTSSYPVINKICITKAYIGFPTHLGAHSFNGQTYLSSVMLSSVGTAEVTGKLGGLQNTIALKFLVVPNSYGLQSTTGGCLGGSGIKNIVFDTYSSNLNNGNSLFDASYIESIRLPKAGFISPTFFYNCTNLKEVVFNESITRIYSQCFMGCINLRNVVLVQGLTTIYNYAFYGCKSLEQLDIPASITTIGGDNFTGCCSLKKLIIRANTPPSMNGYTSIYTSGVHLNFRIYVPDVSIDLYKTTTNWSNYSALYLPISQLD